MSGEGSLTHSTPSKEVATSAQNVSPFFSQNEPQRDKEVEHNPNTNTRLVASIITMTKPTLVVIAPMLPGSVPMDESGTKPVISTEDQAADALDTFNHPRFRRALILKTLEANSDQISFQTPAAPEPNLARMYATVHSEGLLEFLTTAWSQWDGLGEEGRDPGASLDLGQVGAKPLIPTNTPLPRDAHQRPSKNVMGQIGYYCTDMCTPIMKSLLNELQWDSAIIQMAVDKAVVDGALAYAMPTHPGHHAAKDSFGGYCYLNQSALCAKLFQTKYGFDKVAVLDIDYHCGNGTASIFYEDPTVLMVSLHCDPDFDYPFHSGFSDQTGLGAGEGTTLYLPMPPKAQWDSLYKGCLETGLKRIQEFGTKAVVISMGLDTHDKDPCAIRRAGFCLQGTDYMELGKTMARSLKGLPVVIIQEGGYRMETIGQAASNVVFGYHGEM